MKSSKPKPESLETLYRRRHDSVLVRLADALSEHISEHIKGQLRIDRVSVRAKSVDRFLKKAAATNEDGKQKYAEPLDQIQDQIGARIVVFYKSDVDRISALILKYFRAIEQGKIVPDTEAEFGYFGHHLVLVMPSDVIDDDMDRASIPNFFELQIKTLFQHAWSEADHDLGYKPGEVPLTSHQKRMIAFASAQAWGADLIYDQVFEERRPKAVE